MEPLRVERSQVIAYRLSGHNLAARLTLGPLIQACAACGVQNTPPGAAELSLHARVANVQPGEVEAALTYEKSLLQAWSLRAAPTLFPTRDALVFTRGLLPLDEPEMRFFLLGAVEGIEKVGISALELVHLVSQSLEEALAGRALTKDELGRQVAAALAPRLSPTQVKAWQAPSWYAKGQSLGESLVRFALPVAALRGILCHAERVGNQATIRLVREWLGSELPQQEEAGRSHNVNVGDAGSELARRYLRCYGPSTPDQFAAWAGISPAQAQRLWQPVAVELVGVDFAGRLAWLLIRDLEWFNQPQAAVEGARFLPAHDPYLQARDRETLIAEEKLRRLVWRIAGSPGILLVDGAAAALWRAQKKVNRLEVRVELFAPLGRDARKEIEAEAEGMAKLRGCSEAEIKRES